MPSLAFTLAIFEFVLIIFALSLHECAHAWMASRLGDHTARNEGRVTLNPMNHIDIVGSLLIPAVAIFGPFIGFTMFSGALIGWARPTPVLSRNFHKIRRDENLVTLAGPVSNLILALLALVLLLIICHAIPGNASSPSGRDIVLYSFNSEILEGVNPNVQAIVLLGVAAIKINFSLLIFNLLPIPPLDGSQLLRNALPYNAVQAYDRIPFWLSWILMIFVGGTIIRMLLMPALSIVFFILTRF